MAQLQSTNVTGTLCVNGVALGGGGKDFKFCCFTSTGQFTPPTDLVDGDGAVSTTIVAGGGGGGTGRSYVTISNNFTACVKSGGGGGGEVLDAFGTVTQTSNCTITVGGGGTSTSTTGGDGNTGGSSCAFGIRAYGGGGGGGTCFYCQYFGQGTYTCRAGAAGGPPGGCVSKAGSSTAFHAFTAPDSGPYSCLNYQNTSQQAGSYYSWKPTTEVGGAGMGYRKWGIGGHFGVSGTATCGAGGCGRIMTGNYVGNSGISLTSGAGQPGIVVLTWHE